MRVSVETDVGHGGVEVPRRFHFDGREINVVGNLDQWHGSGYCYFKLRDSDGNLYILRLDEAQHAWDLTMFQSARSQTIPVALDPNKEPTEYVRM